MPPAADLRAYLQGHPAHRLAFALDFRSWDDAAPLAQKLRDDVGVFKVGLELFVAGGPAVVKRASKDLNRPIFLDLKLHDIPATVEGAVGSAIDAGAQLLTLHAAAGPAALERAVRRAEGSPLTPVAVTVLTSLGADDLRRMGVEASPAEQVLRMATVAYEAGIRAFVCSPREAGALRATFADALLITPGVRAAAGGDDQQRTASAGEAIKAGADLLVVGRPLRDAPAPVEAARKLAGEIAAALVEAPR